MDTDENAVRAVRLGIRAHQRAIFCRAVMWEAITHAVTEENALRVLDSLLPEEQSYLQNVYADFPPSLWACRAPHEHPLCAVIEQWCQQPKT